MKGSIAYIDDSVDNLEAMGFVLRDEFNVDSYQSSRTFVRKFPAQSYVCILTDVHMPNMDGFKLYEKIVQHPDYNGCPILFISSDDSDAARIRSFELGAVDFIDRGTTPDELIARIKSKIKFFETHRNVIEFGKLKVNLTLLKTYIKGKEIPVTFIELKFLMQVLKNYPEPVSRETLVQEIWNDNLVLDATIYTHIHNLNNKFKEWGYELRGLKEHGVQLIEKSE